MTPTLPAQIITQPRAEFTAETTENDFALVEVELAVWLAALECFLDEQGATAAVDSPNANQTRNRKHEIRIATLCLLECSRLAVDLQPSTSISAEDAALLQTFLRERFALAESFAALDKIDAQTWNAWRGDARRALESNRAAAKLLEQYARFRAAGSLPPALAFVADHPNLEGVVGAEVREFCGKLCALLERLELIQAMLKNDRPLKLALVLFALLKRETVDLISSVENVLQFVAPETALYEILDGFAYIAPMELRKVYEHELVGVAEMRQPTAIFASVENSYGLLKDNFQQTIAQLAQVFAPDLAATEIFPSQQTKLEQSIALRLELWTLLQFTQQIEKTRDADLLRRFNERLQKFRHNTMLFLMFKDFETTERFIEELSRTQRSEEVAQVLHRFGAYLETLMGQVNMRNVLAAAPFDYPQIEF